MGREVWPVGRVKGQREGRWEQGFIEGSKVDGGGGGQESSRCREGGRGEEGGLNWHVSWQSTSFS